MQSESFLQRWMHNEHSQNELRWLFPKEKFNIVFTDIFSCLIAGNKLSIRMIDVVVTGFTLLVVVFYTLVVLLLHLYWQLNSSKESRYWCGVFYWDMQWMSDMAIYKNTIKAISWSSWLLGTFEGEEWFQEEICIWSSVQVESQKAHVSLHCKD